MPPPPNDVLRIASWNVNGLRACAKRGFVRWMGRSGAEIVGVQEVRARPDDLPRSLASPRGWHARWATAERPGYSGVGVYSRRPPDEVDPSLGVRAFDAEGRVLMARFGALLVVSAYFPNGNGQDRDNSRVPYKLRFSRRLYRVLEPEVRRGGHVLVMGDFNTSPEAIDLARPKENDGKTSGFLQEERAEVRRWLRAGWIDTFRAFEPGAGHYTWWSQRFGVRARNVGWRMDLALASPALAPHLRAARIHANVLGSDHCPISVDLDRRALG